MNGYSLFGTKIKTKGPKLLRKEGHTKTKIPSTSPDYRPFKDCTFFMEGSMCKKGTKVGNGVDNESTVCTLSGNKVRGITLVNRPLISGCC